VSTVTNQTPSPNRASLRHPQPVAKTDVAATAWRARRVATRRPRSATGRRVPAAYPAAAPDTCITRMCWGDPWSVDVALLVRHVGHLRTVAPDDPASIFARGVFTSLPPECVLRMVKYQPKVMSEARWERIREFVEDATAVTAPRCAYTQERLLIVCSAYVDWAVNIAGYPLSAKIVFRRELISRYTADHMHQADGTRRNYRAILLRISEVLLPDHPDTLLAPLNDRVSMRPYSEPELTQLQQWANGQNTQNRGRNAMVLLALCAGGGLWSSEVCETRREDIQFDDEGVLVTVHGANARNVPLLARWEPWLRFALDGLEPGDRVFGNAARKNNSKNLVTAFIHSSVHSPGLVQPQTNRMRATWLVTHLAAHTDMRALMTASGVGKFENLARLLQFVPELNTPAYRRNLRGEATR
jgi:integrase